MNVMYSFLQYCLSRLLILCPIGPLKKCLEIRVFYVSETNVGMHEKHAVFTTGGLSFGMSTGLAKISFVIP
jgi:hypothetical protein